MTEHAARRWSARGLLVVAGVLTLASVVAGHVNRHVLDGPTFARHVDELRRDDAVAARTGEIVARGIILANPDLVALRPLIESVATRVTGGDLLSGATKRAAVTAHRALTEEDADLLVLRLADAGALVAGVLAVVVPERVPAAADVSVTLASIGDQAFASTTIDATRKVGTLAWLLPLLAVICFATAIALVTDRWRAAKAAGTALALSAGVLGVLLAIGGFLVRRLDDATLGGAVARASWDVFVRPLWWSVIVVAAVGLAVVVTVSTAATGHLGETAARWRDRLVTRPASPWATAVRAVVLLGLGLAAITDPAGSIELVVLLVGVVLVLYALAEVPELAASARRRADTAAPIPAGRPSSTANAALGALAIAVLAGGVVWMARPAGDSPPVPDAVAGEGVVCNGHAELCDRAYNDVAYATSHNAMSAAKEPGWYLAEHADPIRVQLEQGVRALLIDVWSGRQAETAVRTAASSYEEALAVAKKELGPEIVAVALRIGESIAGEAQGPEERFLCHGLCEVGATPFLSMLADVRVFLATHPDEVVTLFIEDHVAPDLIAADIEQAGLLPYVATPPPVGDPWPTLSEMIRSGNRLVVMVETGRGDETARWLVNGFDYTKDTPFTFRSVEEFSCEPNRGPEDAPLFLVNHWLSNFATRVSDSRAVNTMEVLGGRAEQCRKERGQIPNFVAVNFVSIGALFDVVDLLNGVG